MNADFTRERLEFHKLLIDAHQQRDSAQQQFYDLDDTVKLYQEQYAELEKNMKDGSASKKEVGAGYLFLGILLHFCSLQQNVVALLQNFEMFRKEMDKLGKKLRVVERECTDWKEKFDASNEQVCYFPIPIARESHCQSILGNSILGNSMATHR